MSEPATTRRGYGPGFWCAVALLTLTVYVGMYLLLVRRGHPQTGLIRAEYDYEPLYAANRETSEALASLFSPVHAIDRKARPNRWHVNLFGGEIIPASHDEPSISLRISLP